MRPTFRSAALASLVRRLASGAFDRTRHQCQALWPRALRASSLDEP